MKRIVVHALIIALFVAMLIVPVAAVKPTTTPDAHSDLWAAITALQDDVEALEAENTELRETITALETRVEALESGPVCTDGDGDGVTTCAGDCDDANPGVLPDGTETCDGADNDCDGYVDEGELCDAGQTCLGTGGCACPDDDGDGVTTCDSDCNDADPGIFPGSSEICNNVDEDCDGVVDDGAYCMGGSTCVSGRCVATCTSPETECNGGCVNTGTDIQNCGTCGALCSIANGNPLCSTGTCSVGSCNSGFLNCDSDAANGCEINANTNMANCGSCNRACPATIANGVSTCMQGSCAASCSFGFGNCDNDIANGCEINFNTNTANCGECAHACIVANGLPACSAGACTVASCNAGYADCDHATANGCEINLNTNTANCGTCGHACNIPNGLPACSAGACTVASCSPGFLNCDNDATNGCEINFNTDAANCGTCGFRCGATQSCTNGQCV